MEKHLTFNLLILTSYKDTGRATALRIWVFIFLLSSHGVLSMSYFWWPLRTELLQFYTGLSDLGRRKEVLLLTLQVTRCACPRDSSGL